MFGYGDPPREQNERFGLRLLPLLNVFAVHCKFVPTIITVPARFSLALNVCISLNSVLFSSCSIIVATKV